jgi:NADPH:quinone reductase
VRGYTNLSLDWSGQGELLTEVLGHAEAGRLTVRHDVRPLDEVVIAWGRQLDGTAHRRVVLVP